MFKIIPHESTVSPVPEIGDSDFLIVGHYVPPTIRMGLFFIPEGVLSPNFFAYTGDKDLYTQWTHCEHIVSTDNMLPQCAQWAHFDHIQNLPPNVAKMCALNLFRICATTVATICPAVT